MAKNDNPKNVRCSFCGKSQDSVKKIVAGPGVFICDECVDLCTSIIEAEKYEEDELGYTLNDLDKIPNPKEIKKILDDYVILRHKNTSEFIIVKGRKDVNAIERREFSMMSKEYCRYIRTYSELEGLQHAHTLVYCGAAAAQGVVMELRQEQDGRVRRSAVLLQNSFARAMQLLRYLCENSIGLEQWLDVLDDAGQSYELLENAGEAGMVPDFTGKNLEFCAICRF